MRLETLLMTAVVVVLAAGCAEYPVYSKLPYDYGEGYGGGVYDPGYHGDPGYYDTGLAPPGHDASVSLGFGMYGGPIHPGGGVSPWIYPWYHLPYYHTHAFASPYYPRYPLGPQTPWRFPYDPGNVTPGVGPSPRFIVPGDLRGRPAEDRHRAAPHTARSPASPGVRRTPLRSTPRGVSRVGSRPGVSARRGARAPSMRSGAPRIDR